ncbi:PIN domain-containing protein [Picosynechococcus sp. PCC 7117]|uniref:PIN domain-containing protein n=1 Tax=Picosynechococcus sp. PCC 7117 TaxID=195498 RepID=UPI0008109965|nr:PIN domain-containing protein [Picosynechococcus sp. PCC 7117]ANV89158.1 PIN domain-containing protein [Picosynechococcus sp. PCC 7117]
MANNFTALIDACVLYKAPVRDLLMRLAVKDLYRAKWTNEIHDEWIRNLLKNRPDIEKKRLERTRDLMNSHIRDCLVDGYQELIESLELPDKGDRHVLAAAICARADVIVTCNELDFPSQNIKKYGIEVQNPDVFISHLIDLDPLVVCDVVRTLRESLKNPPRSINDLLAGYKGQGLTRTVQALEKYSELL